MPTYLDAIVAAHRAAAAKDTRRLGDIADLVDEDDLPRGFADALKTPTLSIIAEIKRRSPSKGDLAPDLVPADLAAAYEAGGASCISVLTDVDHFGGSASDLREARAACKIPLLRKDFTVDVRDVVDARLMGADAVLLIVAALDDGELRRFLSTAYDLHLDALVEVHDEAELDRALEAGATIIGVNQRDLTTFAVDHELAARLRPLIPLEHVAVAESGVRGADDVRALAAAGYDAVLVGETLVKSADPAAEVESFPERGMFVKICGTTSEEDALLAVAMGADAVGFILSPSPRQMAVEEVGHIVHRLPREILTFGVFKDESPQRMVEAVHAAGLQAAQIHGGTADDTRWVRERVPTVFKVFDAGDPSVRRAREYGADAVMIDNPQPGSGQVFDWSLAEDVPGGLHLVLQGGLHPLNVADAIHTVHPWGVDVCTGVEASPGHKDPRKVRAFIAAVRAAAPEVEVDEGDPDGEHPYDWRDDG